MNLSIIKQVVTSNVARQVLVAQKHSPTALFVVGVGGVIGTIVLASRATLRVDEVLTETQDTVERAAEFRDRKDDDFYTEENYKRDMVLIHTKGAIKIAKLYAPAFLLGVVSIACLAGGQIVLSRRNAGLTLAYAAVDKAFKEYRTRVVDELGEDKDREFRYGFEDREIVVETAKGHKVKTVRTVKPGEPSQYAKFFDEYSPSWEPNSEMNLYFIKCQQQWANDRLRARGHLFLNEVYDSLGIDRTGAGAQVGWVMRNDDGGDNYVDFGVFDESRERARAFVNGREKSILLDFNVDGVILDLIDKK